MNKEELRKIYIQKRKEISSREKLKLDDLMLIHFQQLYFEEIYTLLTYWPGAGMQEPNTHLFSGFLRHMIPALQIAYPVTDFTTATMQALLIDETTLYHTNHFGIMEPEAGIEVHAPDIDVAFVPLLVCDENGCRVNYANDLYDTYLAQCRDDTIKIGFSYFDAVGKIDDRDVFDVSLNYCVTPRHVYEF